jgi:hypothetical protein
MQSCNRPAKATLRGSTGIDDRQDLVIHWLAFDRVYQQSRRFASHRRSFDDLTLYTKCMATPGDSLDDRSVPRSTGRSTERSSSTSNDRDLLGSDLGRELGSVFGELLGSLQGEAVGVGVGMCLEIKVDCPDLPPNRYWAIGKFHKSSIQSRTFSRDSSCTWRRICRD